ncbi:tRNA 2-selenouridine(34) synthase MnmH [Marivivens niveibacter]|uniref:tRNA 2-selenouridine(34) synthase MnmH n=1 Tax=Marivivens niveibacter TaxID=1930667 RepID=A0A251WZ94_9RHOB|nr:tRNA 2-selenouridine(34) synthase MnmH [Marivivens niveibacter]OUD09800.1 tRNA 2-selenouridine(34) synthase MnmH [Marivivens niveibacter]
MPIEFTSLSDLMSHGFDTVIDVRSPAEYAEDHVPDAISLPAMSNEERAKVGTIYKQVSPFDARKIGAAIVSRNVAHHLETALADKDGGWKPLVYCWRGGQRSGSVAIILKQIGWRADTIAGGYRTYRRFVFQDLHEKPLPHRVVLLDGNTGTAKTDILKRLPAHGIQILDLEGAAQHRGSMLGGMVGGQPDQKAFESTIACALARMDPTRPVVIEAESSKIGKINIPPSLWSAMCAAPRIDIGAPLDERARYLAGAYHDLSNDADRLMARLQPLRQHRSHATVDKWEQLFADGDMHGFAAALMQDHYDPSYAKSRAVHTPTVLHTIEPSDLTETGQAAAATQLADIIKSL